MTATAAALDRFHALDELEPEAVRDLLALAARLERHPEPRALAGRILGLLFFNPSLRTLASMQSAMARLGGSSIVLSPGQGTWKLETRRGVPYERVYVFGFSNGAYYGSQLALRDRGPLDGFAVFAGGSGGRWLEPHGRNVKTRAPMYVECAINDKTAIGDARQLRHLLEKLGWPHRYVERRTGGHAMSDRGVANAIEFLNRP